MGDQWQLLAGLAGSALVAYLVVRVTQADHEARLKHVEEEVKILRERWHTIVNQTQKVVGDMFKQFTRRNKDDD